MSAVVAGGGVPRGVGDPLRLDVVPLVLTAIPFAVAMMFTIFDFAERDAMATLMAICLLCTISVVLRTRAGIARQSDVGMLIFNLGMIFWFYLPGLATARSSVQWRDKSALAAITNLDALYAVALITFFHYVVVMAYMLAIKPRTLAVGRNVFGENARFDNSALIVRILAIWYALSMGFYIVAAGSPGAAIQLARGGRNVPKPWSAVGNFGTELTPFHNIAAPSLVVIAVLSTTLMLLGQRDTGIALNLTQRVTLLAIAGTSIWWVSVEGGTRSTLLQAILPPVVLYYRRLHEPGRPQRSRAPTYILIALIAIAAVYGASYQRKYRYQKVENEYYATMQVDFKVKDNDFLTPTAYAVAIQREEGRFIMDVPLLHVLLGPVPRVVWPNKPYLESVVVYSYYIWGYDIEEVGGNTLPSIVGQWYLGWGWGGVLFVGLLLGRFVRLADAVFATTRSTLVRTLLAIAMSYVFVSFRTMSYGFFGPVIMSLLIARFLRRRRGAVSPQPALSSP